MTAHVNDFFTEGSSALKPNRKQKAGKAVIIELPIERLQPQARPGAECVGVAAKASAPVRIVAASIPQHGFNKAPNATSLESLGDPAPKQNAERVRPYSRVLAKESRLSRLLARSEMFCSLAFEDVRGVAYGLMSHKAIAALSCASALVAIVALVFGA